MDNLTQLFSPSCWVPGKSRDEVMNEFFSGIQNAYEELKNDSTVEREEDVPYGQEDSQKVDVWGEVKDKLLIFLHGGYWAEGTRKDCLTPAKCVLSNDFAFASVGYRLAVNGITLTETVEDAVKGVDFVLQKYPNVTTVILGGHSAGAHLAFHAATKLRNPRIRSLIVYSGCFFLKELVPTEIGRDINLTEEQAELNNCNPADLEKLKLKMLFILGNAEAPKLIEQNLLIMTEVENPEDVELVEVSSSSHYTIMTNMMDATSDENIGVSKFLQSF